MFRKTATDAKKAHPLGSVIALRTLFTSLFVGFFTLFGLINLQTRQPSVGTAKHVHEGSKTTKGDLLLTLSTGLGEVTQESISHRMQSQLDNLQPEQEKIVVIHEKEASALTQALKHIDKQIYLQTKHMALAQDSAQRDEILASEGHVSLNQAQGKQAIMFEQQTLLSDLNQQRADIAKKLAGYFGS
jgi:hypothetical protein